MTKVIFGYVILILLIGSILLWLINRKVNNYKKSVLIMLIAFTTVMPYLIYTYNLTGKVFYWGNSGGMSLYWMSTPYENEYGSWEGEFLGADIECYTPLLKLNHQKDIDHILKYRGVQKDDAYKTIAINNIKTHPVRYIKNIFANLSSLLFGFPITYTAQIPLLTIWYFSIIYALILFCSVPTIINWRKIAFCIKFLLVFVLFI